MRCAFSVLGAASLHTSVSRARFSEDQRRGLFWAGASALGGGCFAIPWKLASGVGDSSTSALILLAVAASANTLLVAVRHWTRTGSGFAIGRSDLGVALLLAVFTLFGNLASAEAIESLTPALLNVLLRAEVILVALLGWLVLGERVDFRFWIGASLAVMGLVVIQGPLGSQGLRGILGSGTGAALGGAVCFSSMAVVTRHFIHRIHPVTVNALRLWFAVALWFVMNPPPVLAEVPGEQILFAGLAALAGPFFGRLCIMQSARYLEARVSVLTSLATPVLTLLLAWAVLGDWPKHFELVGGAIMIGGIAVPLIRFGHGSSVPATSIPKGPDAR